LRGNAIPAQGIEGIQATHTFHIEIQQDHVDIQSIRQIDRARAVARFGDHFKARIKLQ